MPELNLNRQPHERRYDRIQEEKNPCPHNTDDVRLRELKNEPPIYLITRFLATRRCRIVSFNAAGQSRFERSCTDGKPRVDRIIGPCSIHDTEGRNGIVRAAGSNSASVALKNSKCDARFTSKKAAHHGGLEGPYHTISLWTNTPSRINDRQWHAREVAD